MATMSINNNPPTSDTAIAISIIVILLSAFFIHQRKHVRNAIRARLARRELARQLLLLVDDDDHDDDASTKAKDTPVVTGIFIHPVKSFRPVSLSQTTFDERGLVGDRRLMVVRPSYSIGGGGTDATHRFLTQRQAPSLATIDASLPVEITLDKIDDDLDEILNDKTNFDKNDGILDLSNASLKTSKIRKTILRLSHGEGSARTHVHIDVTPSTLKSLPISYRAGLWDDVVTVVDVGDAAASFVANIVKADAPHFQDVRVVYVAGGRTIDEKYCPDAARVGWMGKDLPETGLTDGFPILVTAQSSLAELNRRLKIKGDQELPMSRFRPNIVIGNTSKPFDEDTWKAIRIGTGPSSIVLHISKGCPRCKESCTDQITGERFDEPLKTLADFRSLGPDVYFGQNATLHGDSGSRKLAMIRVGDPVTILTRGDPVFDRPGMVGPKDV